MSTWVLLRGVAREQGHWGMFPEVLRRQLPAADRIACVDLPGNGERWRETSPMGVEPMLDAVRSELRRRACAPPFVPVALSLGGMVAMHWMQRHPGDLAACVLVNTSAAGLSPWWQRLRPGTYLALLRWLLGASPGAREAAVYRATSNRPLDAAVLDAWTEIAQTHPVRCRNVLRQLVAAARFRAPLSAPVPLLLVSSREDRLVSHQCSLALARAWHQPVREHDWSGHDLPLDDPQWLAAVIAGWQSRLRR